MIHKPVLLKEVLSYLDPQEGENFIDCTVGFGGHSLEIAKKIQPGGKVLGIDWDGKSLKFFKKTLEGKAAGDNLILKQGNFSEIKKIAEENDFKNTAGVLMDLGISSWQIDKSGRGFSFQKQEPLNMSYDGKGLTAYEIINFWREEDLKRIIGEYGEERYAGRVARVIKEARAKRRVETTKELVEIIKPVLLKKYRSQKLHFATRTFQALRIAANSELENLRQGLVQSPEVLKKNGKIAVISFHSLEDRIVKNFFRDQKGDNCLKILTKKPIVPSNDEIKENSRARSAKLRVAEVL